MIRSFEKLFEKAFYQRILSFILIVSLSIITFSFPASAFMQRNIKFNNKTAGQVQQLTKADTSKQSALFAQLATSKLKYVTARSLRGKNKEWMAFVDIYQVYDEGQPTKEYILQRATAQYGLKMLPASAESCMLSIGPVSKTIQADKQSLFNLPTSPSLMLSSSADSDLARIQIYANKDSANIILKEDYPSSDFLEIDELLMNMTPAFLDYLSSKSNYLEGGFDHSFLRLKSYINDPETMQRSYSWELVFVLESNLPSKAIIVRYDCDEEKVSSVSNREIRSYFS